MTVSAQLSLACCTSSDDPSNLDVDPGKKLERANAVHANSATEWWLYIVELTFILFCSLEILSGTPVLGWQCHHNNVLSEALFAWTWDTGGNERRSIFFPWQRLMQGVLSRLK